MARHLSRARLAALAGLLVWASPSALAAPACTAPDPVCAARDAVFRISSFDPNGSAVRIAEDLLVTNRHVVADETRVRVHLKSGAEVDGEVLPTIFAGDLVLVRAKLPAGPVLSGQGATGTALYTVGLDLGARAVSVFPKGDILLEPAADKDYARLYHTAHSQPGTSGGAMVDDAGQLVGIATSGGEGRNEAIPVSQIARLRRESAPQHAARSKAIGKAYRECTLIVDTALRSRDVVPPDIADQIETSCRASGNRQLTDLAGQILGRSRMFDRSIKLFRDGLEKDPNAINTRLGLVVILVYAQRYAEAADPVRWLLDVIPEEREVLQYAVRIGKATDDKALMERALALIEKHNPAGLEAAKRFIAAPKRR